MNDQHDLEIMVVSRFPIILIESHEEARGLDLLDFHPYLQYPVNVRLVKNIAQNYHKTASACNGFSGAEIEQAVVAALYEAVAEKQPLSDGLMSAEIQRTRPLSVVMSEKLQALRDWAKDRTVQANS